MKPSRRTQPYRPEGGRDPGQALDAMQRGRTFGGYNPMDAQREAYASGPADGDGRPARRPRKPRPWKGR